MSVVKTMNPTLGDVLKHEYTAPNQGNYCREVVTIKQSASLKIGAVLGKITASGKYILSAPGAADGSQTPAAVLLVDCDASGADVSNVLVLVRGPAIVSKDALSYDATINTSNLKATANAALASLGIIARTTA